MLEVTAFVNHFQNAFIIYVFDFKAGSFGEN